MKNAGNESPNGSADASAKDPAVPPCRSAGQRLTIHRAGHDEVSISLSKSDRTGHIDGMWN